MAGERERTLAECDVDNAAAQGKSESNAVGHPGCGASTGAEERDGDGDVLQPHAKGNRERERD